MTTDNRYAPPRAVVEQAPAASDDLWRRTSSLPSRCIKCNEPAVAPARRVRLAWHPPAWYLLILLAVLVYALVALLVRKKAVVHLGLCERHQRRVLWGRGVGWGGFAVLVAMVAWSMAGHTPAAAGIALLLLLPWALATIWINRLVLPARIDDRYVRLKGCGPAFLRSLPDRTWDR